MGKKYAEARKEVKGSWHCENGSSVLKKLQKNCEVSQYVKPEKKQKKKKERERERERDWGTINTGAETVIKYSGKWEIQNLCFFSSFSSPFVVSRHEYH